MIDYQTSLVQRMVALIRIVQSWLKMGSAIRPGIRPQVPTARKTAHIVGRKFQNSAQNRALNVIGVFSDRAYVVVQ